jgi:predicted Zn-dependent protease
MLPRSTQSLLIAESTMLDETLATIDPDKTPSSTAYHLTRASILFDRGLLENAIDETHTALVADPENAALHAILARLYAETGQAKRALAETDKASVAR